MNRAAFALLASLIACACASPARAQSWTDRGYLDISAGVRLSPMTFSGVAHPTEFVETATVTTTYDVKTSPGFDGAVGVRVWRNLAVGVDVSWTTKSSTGSIDAQIPHPLYFNRPRAVSGQPDGLTHDETGVHVQALWVIPARPKWSVALAGGPSWIIVNQAIVSDVTIASAYPFDTATFAGAVSTSVSHGALGFNVGGDVAYYIRPRTGVGFGVNYSQARVPLTPASGATVTVTAGGARINGGLRIRF